MAEVRSSGSCSVPARSRLRAALEAARAPLLERGYAVVDNALSRADAALLHEEMASLRSRNVLRQHRFGFRSSTTAVPQIYEKPHIFEAELDDDHLHTEAPRLVTALSRIRLAEEAAAAFPDLKLHANRPPPADRGVTVKLQCNEGHGGCFPLHYDNAGPPSRRRLTILTYLNPEWVEGDGGELQLLPWLERARSIRPLHGRIVLFLSDVILHRVLPSRATRYCFTVWLNGDGTNSTEATSLKVGEPTQTCLQLPLSPAQRLLSRAVYDDEYAVSIRECMAEPAMHQAAEAMLKAHRDHVEASRENRGLQRLVEAAVALRRERELCVSGVEEEGLDLAGIETGVEASDLSVDCKIEAVDGSHVRLNAAVR